MLPVEECRLPKKLSEYRFRIIVSPLQTGKVLTQERIIRTGTADTL